MSFRGWKKSMTLPPRPCAINRRILEPSFRTSAGNRGVVGCSSRVARDRSRLEDRNRGQLTVTDFPNFRKELKS